MSADLFGQAIPDPAPTPAAPEKPKPAKDRIRGVVKVVVADEDYKVEMRASGITVRRCRKKHVSHKSMQDLVDWVTGQKQLPL